MKNNKNLLKKVGIWQRIHRNLFKVPLILCTKSKAKTTESQLQNHKHGIFKKKAAAKRQTQSCLQMVSFPSHYQQQKDNEITLIASLKSGERKCLASSRESSFSALPSNICQHQSQVQRCGNKSWQATISELCFKVEMHLVIGDIFARENFSTKILSKQQEISWRQNVRGRNSVGSLQAFSFTSTAVGRPYNE